LFAAEAFSFTTGSEIRSKQATSCSWLQESSTDSKRSLKTLRYGAFSTALKVARYRHTLQRVLSSDAEPVAAADRPTAALRSWPAAELGRWASTAKAEQ
jgi:hypothetical protein